MHSRLKQVLEEIVCERAPGPSASFSVLHVLKALEIMSEKAVGRSRLAADLNVGEGTVRTLINRLKDAGLIVISEVGCALTKDGLDLWKEIKSVFEKKNEIGKNELTISEYNVAVLVKNRGHKVKSGVEQRDAAVMAGAKGATTILSKKRCLVIPSVSNDVAKDFPNAADQMFSLLQPEENDVVIIGSADTLIKAEYGALAAALTLLDDC